MIARLRRSYARLRDDYRTTFDGPAAEPVLADLATFCRARETTHVPGDPHASALLEGRREVWLRIAELTQLSNEELWRLRGIGDE